MFYLFLQVVNDGIILSFVSYPSAMSYMDAPPLWSFLFFFMLVNLAISSSCGGIQTIATFFMDEWPSLRKKRMLVFICISVFLYLCGKKITKRVNAYHIAVLRCFYTLLMIHFRPSVVLRRRNTTIYIVRSAVYIKPPICSMDRNSHCRMVLWNSKIC